VSVPESRTSATVTSRSSRRSPSGPTSSVKLGAAVHPRARSVVVAHRRSRALRWQSPTCRGRWSSRVSTKAHAWRSQPPRLMAHLALVPSVFGGAVPASRRDRRPRYNPEPPGRCATHRELAVAFLDLVGFPNVRARLSTEDLAIAVADFETLAGGVIAGHEARLGEDDRRRSDVRLCRCGGRGANRARNCAMRSRVIRSSPVCGAGSCFGEMVHPRTATTTDRK